VTETKNLKERDLSSLRIDPKAKHSSSRSSKSIVWIILGLSVIFCVCGFLLLKGQKIPVEVATARPARGNEGMAVLNASGYVTPRRRATVAAKITGRIKEMLVEEGMKVEKGQVLARLDDADAKATYESARADRDVAKASIPELEINLVDAERTYKRNAGLVEKGVVDTQTFEKSEALFHGLKARLNQSKGQVKAAEAKMKVAKREIENCTIRAPFSGIAVSKDAQVGEIVSPMSAGGSFTRTGISTIVDMSSLEIEVDVNESYIAKVTIGQKVAATLDAYPDWHIPAKVRTVIPTADRQKATVKVRIAFDQLDPRILPDMGVKVTFLSEARSESQSQVKALIPRDALRETEGRNIVFVVKNGRLEQRVVTPGNLSGDEIEILAGITPGEQLVVQGPSSMKDGQKVKVKP
jgi:RND family efflux transporter MFP subunit